MQKYAAEAEDWAFAGSGAYCAELEAWLAGEEAARLQHAELEDQLLWRGRELLCLLHKDHLDLPKGAEAARSACGVTYCFGLRSRHRWWLSAVHTGQSTRRARSA